MRLPLPPRPRPSQVRKLQLERTQHGLLLESLQQRHQADLELIESAHRYLWHPPGEGGPHRHAGRGPLGGCPSVSRSRVKMLETTYEQREERLRRENEELAARCVSQRQEAEQARAELTAQHQRRLATAVQEKDQEVERLRELQR